MPSKKDHLQQAFHNEKFALSFDIERTPYKDWLVTIAFYAAVHFVEAYFATMNYHSPNHEARDNAISRSPGTKPIAFEYSELKQHSFNARYMVYQFSSATIRNEVLLY